MVEGALHFKYHEYKNNYYLCLNRWIFSLFLYVSFSFFFSTINFFTLLVLNKTNEISLMLT